MLTIEKMKEFGADVNEGLSRCMNNEGFYLRLVNMALSDQNFGRLETALADKNEDAAFEAAHALKGVLGNLSLTPIYRPVCALTEELRAKSGMNYEKYSEEIREAKAELQRLSAGE